MTDSPGPAGNSADAGATAPAMTPEAALARHIEWLEFALAAASSEETWRASRLEKATKKNLGKRTARLTDVRDEIAELSALLEAIHGLRRRAASASSSATAPRRRGRPPKSASAASPGSDLATPRRRGRPPKTATASTATTTATPRRRGRPPKSASTDAAIPTTAAAPRRRGRPPKAVNAEGTPVTATPRRRGRPPNAPHRYMTRSGPSVALRS
jgi:hypothetical protein